jgi:hypothetical protein
MESLDGSFIEDFGGIWPTNNRRNWFVIIIIIIIYLEVEFILYLRYHNIKNITFDCKNNFIHVHLVLYN